MSQARHFIAAETASPPFFVGIDLGGTNIKFGVVDDLGRPLSWLSIPTEVQRGPEDAARRMGAAVREAIAKAGIYSRRPWPGWVSDRPARWTSPPASSSAR